MYTMLTVRAGANTKTSEGCLPSLQLPAWGFKALVLKDEYVGPTPVITKFLPGHDYRALSNPSIPIQLHFSAPMNCQQIANALQINSTTQNRQVARLDPSTIRCHDNVISDSAATPLCGVPQTTWSFTGTLINVYDGVHQISINNVSTLANRNITTNSHDHFLLRVGQRDNPIVFPNANYSTNLLLSGGDKGLYVSHKAAGAEMFRYSLNFGTTYSDWAPYPNGDTPNSTLAPKNWSGTTLQGWKGEHVIVQYWNRLVGSSDHVQHADLGIGSARRQLPHVFLEGTFNQYGFDGGIANQMQMSQNDTWTFDYIEGLPAQVSINVWGVNPDGQLDETRVYGDIDADCVLDRIPPLSLINNVINITDPPPSPFLGWRIAVNDADYRYQLQPIGSRWNQLALYILLWVIPIMTGAASIWVFMKSFYSTFLSEPVRSLLA